MNISTTRKASQNFGTGGCFKCRICGKNTRSTGRQDNEHVLLCARCYDMAGDENAVADGQMTVAEFKAQWGQEPRN